MGRMQHHKGSKRRRGWHRTWKQDRFYLKASKRIDNILAKCQSPAPVTSSMPSTSVTGISKTEF